MRPTGPIQTDEEGLYYPWPKIGKISTPYAAGMDERKALMEAARCGNTWAAEELKKRYGITEWIHKGKKVI